MNRLVIIGAGGHGRVVADIARLSGYESILFLDDGDVPAASGKVSDYVRYTKDADFVVAIGNSPIREKIQAMLVSGGCTVVSLVHPDAVIGSNVSIGVGSVVMAGVVINVGTKIGDGVIINTCSSVDHDCVIGDYCHISVGAHLAGNVRIGKRTMVGAGATVINNITVCDECIIGAGAVVVKDISIKGIYKGVPATL